MNKLRLTEDLHRELLRHFTYDDNEALAFVLCGSHVDLENMILVGREVIAIPHDQCTERRPDFLSWDSHVSIPVIEKAKEQGLSVLRVHSHPGGYENFSLSDDDTDRTFFPSVHCWIDDDLPHASAVMLPDGKLVARLVDRKGRFTPVDSVLVVGHNLRHWTRSADSLPRFADRSVQAFGKGTMKMLARMRIGVVGCSGTGSVVIEQLVRLGVGHLVLIDPDVMGEENLNRIVNTTAADAKAKHPKVEALRNRIFEIGLGTQVTAMRCDVETVEAVHALAACDILFGCVDTATGRYVLNRVATYYGLPYIDIGVSLEADGIGGVKYVGGAVHYLRPGGSSLLSREAITAEQLKTEGLAKHAPDLYKDEVQRGYIKGVEENHPAVISVNMLYGSMAVLELLARIHKVRLAPNEDNESFIHSFSSGVGTADPEGAPCPDLANMVGLGDIEPPLGMPALSGSHGESVKGLA